MLRKFSSRHSGAFTLVELLVVVVIIGILTSIALPNYVGAEIKAKEASVRGCMRTAQVAAEAAATQSSGVYPLLGAELNAYLPGGEASPGGAAGSDPVNPFTNMAQPIIAGPAVAPLVAFRTMAPVGQAAGTVGYATVDENALPRSSYGITGGGANGLTIPGTQAGTTLVYSNM